MAHLQESFPAPWVAAALALPAGSALLYRLFDRSLIPPSMFDIQYSICKYTPSSNLPTLPDRIALALIVAKCVGAISILTSG